MLAAHVPKYFLFEFEQLMQLIIDIDIDIY